MPANNMDLFDSEELRAYWEAREVRSYVVRLGYYPKGCWVTGARVTRPTDSVTVYVRARNQSGAIRAAKIWAHTVHRLPESKLIADHVRYLSPLDFQL